MVNCAFDKYIVVLAVFFGVFLGGCTQQEDAPGSISLTPQQDILRLPYTSGTLSIPVQAAGGSWQLSDNLEWATVTKTDETALSIQYSSNADTYRFRGGKITLSINHVLVHIHVEQRPRPYIKLSEKNISLLSTSGQVGVSVGSSEDEPWAAQFVESLSWISWEKLSESILLIHFKTNTGVKRQAQLKIFLPNTDIFESITLTQHAAPSLDIQPSMYIKLPLHAGDTTLRIRSTGGAWSYVPYHEYDWARFSSDEEGLYVDYDHNLKSSRIATVEVVVPTAFISKKIFLLQAGPTINVSPALNIRLPAHAEDTILTITSTYPEAWTFASSATWLNVTKEDSRSLHISYQANTGNIRQADIQILPFASSASSTSKSIFILQEKQSLRLMPSSILTLLPSAGDTLFYVHSTYTAPWTFSSAATWLNLTKEDSRKLHISYQENTGGDSRRALIYINVASVSRVISVLQEDEALTIKPHREVRISANAGDTTLTVLIGNREARADEWTLSVAGSDTWLHAVKARESKVDISFERNVGLPRQGIVYVAAVGSGSTVSAILKQSGPELLIMPSYDLRLPYFRGDTALTVLSTGYTWTFDNDVPWLNVSKTSETKLSIRYNFNKDSPQRAIITVSSTALPPARRYVFVYQEGFED